MWLSCIFNTRAWDVALSPSCVLWAPQLTSSPFKGRASLSLSFLEAEASFEDLLAIHVLILKGISDLSDSSASAA